MSDSEHNPTKKRRKALSCYDCRRRKLKCDRVYPSCGRCVKQNLADQCTYDAQPGEHLHPPYGNASSSADLAGGEQGHSMTARTDVGEHALERLTHKYTGVVDDQMVSKLFSKLEEQKKMIESLNRRIAKVERNSANDVKQRLMLDSFMARSPADSLYSHHAEHPSFQIRTPVHSRFRGKGWKTTFTGASHPAAPLAQFSELEVFVKGVLFLDQPFQALQAELGRVFHRRRSVELRKPVVENDEDLFSLLPDQATLQTQVDLYFETFEKMYRILHVPSFWLEWTEYWNDASKRRPGFTVILLLLSSIAACSAMKDGFSNMNNMLLFREEIACNIQSSDSWISRQSQKHLTLTYFQVSCLLIIAKQTNSIKLKRIWTNTGNLLRFSIAEGLHLEPSRLSRVSMFQQEMRRRLWGTIMELDVLTSMDKGMRTALYGLEFDCQPPRNIEDGGFNESSIDLPPTQSDDDYTSTSYLNFGRRTLQLRLSMMEMLNNNSEDVSFEDVLAQEQKITKAIQSFQPVQKERDGTLRLPLGMLEVELRSFLLLFHSQFIKVEDAVSQRSYSRFACLDASSRIIQLYYDMQNISPIFMIYTSHLFRAALVSKQVVFLMKLESESSLNMQLNQDTYEKALALLRDKIMRMGQPNKQYYLLIASQCLIRSLDSDTNEQEQQREALQKVVDLYKSSFMNEGSTPGSGTTLTPVNANDVPIGPNQDIGIPGNHEFNFVTTNMPMDMYNMNEISDWMFGDLWGLDAFMTAQN